MRILVIDDSKLQRFSIQRILTRAGYDVVLAGDGEEGLRLARETSPNLILLDMMLPRLDGPAVLDALKKDPAMMHTPVIVLTSLSQRNEEKLMSAGAAAFYQKSELGIEKGAAALVDAVGRLLHKSVKAQASGVAT